MANNPRVTVGGLRRGQYGHMRQADGTHCHPECQCTGSVSLPKVDAVLMEREGRYSEMLWYNWVERKRKSTSGISEL